MCTHLAAKAVITERVLDVNARSERASPAVHRGCGLHACRLAAETVTSRALRHIFADNWRCEPDETAVRLTT